MTDLLADVRAIRASGGYITRTDLRIFTLRGADVASYLQTQVTSDVLSLGECHSQPSALVDKKSYLVANFLLFRLPDTYCVVVSTTCSNALIEHLDAFTFRQDVLIEDQTSAWSILHCEGPKTAFVLKGAWNLDITITPNNLNVVSFDGHPGIILPWSESGESGVLALLPASQAEVNTHRFAAFANEHGCVKFSEKALDTVRIEAGSLVYGVDMDRENKLPETGLEHSAVCYTKGCYLGQESINKVKNFGTIATAMLGVEIDGEHQLPQRTAIICDGVPAGELRRSAYSPTLRKTLALAYLKREFRNHGQRFTFDIAGQRFEAIVRNLPFYRPLAPEERAKKNYDEALRLFAKHDDETAVSLLREAVAQHPRYKDAYEALGVILGRLERFDDAVAVMKRLAEVDPTEPMAHTNLSVFYMKMGRKDEAEKEATRATVLSIKRAAGEAKMKKEIDRQQQELRKQLNERMAMFREVLEQEDPDDQLANYGMGKAYFDLGQYNEAIPYLAKAIAVKKLYSVAYVQLGKCYEALGDKEQALAKYADGIKVATQKGDLMPLKEMEYRKGMLEQGLPLEPIVPAIQP